jgi:type VI secretion system secreted protein Hcp
MRLQRVFFAFVVLGVVFLLGGLYGWAAEPVYVKIKGQKQGDIKGSCTIKGREDTIVVYSIGHNILVRTDPQTGLPTNDRVHNPMKILKEIDQSSPKLYQAMVTNENLTEFRMSFYRIDPRGLVELYFTIDLTNARIVSIAPSFPTALLSQNDSYRHMETVAFTYQKIKWTWVDGGITSEDTWTTPLQ